MARPARQDGHRFATTIAPRRSRIVVRFGSSGGIGSRGRSTAGTASVVVSRIATVHSSSFFGSSGGRRQTFVAERGDTPRAPRGNNNNHSGLLEGGCENPPLSVGGNVPLLFFIHSHPNLHTSTPVVGQQQQKQKKDGRVLRTPQTPPVQSVGLQDDLGGAGRFATWFVIQVTQQAAPTVPNRGRRLPQQAAAAQLPLLTCKRRLR